MFDRTGMSLNAGGKKDSCEEVMGKEEREEGGVGQKGAGDCVRKGFSRASELVANYRGGKGGKSCGGFELLCVASELVGKDDSNDFFWDPRWNDEASDLTIKAEKEWGVTLFPYCE